MRYAVATSAAAIVFITLGGIVSYLTNGLSAGVNLSSYGFYLIGYVDLVEWTILGVTAVPTALIGVKYAPVPGKNTPKTVRTTDDYHRPGHARNLFPHRKSPRAVTITK